MQVGAVGETAQVSAAAANRLFGAGLPGGAASQPLNRKFGRTATTPLVTNTGNTHYDALQTSLDQYCSRR